MSQSDEEVGVILGDTDSTRLLERIMDKLDLILVRQGFQFREDRDWQVASAAIEKWIFEHYDDLTGGDEDYDPKKPLLSDSSEAICDDLCSDDEDEDEIDEVLAEEISPVQVGKKRSREGKSKK